MGWHKAQTWSEAAFLNNALPELTNAMGLHLIISDLDRPHDSELDYALIDPQTVAELREDWVRRAARCFPEQWFNVINNRVASADNFYLNLVSHLDQVRFTVAAPKWIGALRGIAVGLAMLTVLALSLVIRQPFGPALTHTTIVVAEVAPLLAAVLGIASAIGRDKFRSKRAQLISDNVRRELRTAIVHGFGRPITELAQEVEVLKELSLD